MSIVIDQLHVHLGTRPVLHGISLQALPGRVLGIVGPNGSGKTTLLRTVAGQLSPARGTLHYHGHAHRPDTIAHMPQDNQAPVALTVFETVLLGRLRSLALKVTEDDLHATAQVLQRLDLAALAQRPLGALSGGQRQLVFLAQALVSNPSVLLLDEPISALDWRHQLEVLTLVRRITHEQQLTTLLVIHDLNAALHHCDDVALLRQGQLQTSGPAGDVITAEAVATVFGVHTHVLHTPDGRRVLSPMAQPEGPSH
jgi:iron complex transport system ATP-binding protein